MNGLDLQELDGRLEQASRAWRSWRQRARTATREQLAEDPFVGRRAISTRAMFQKLQKLPEELPERDSLLRWLAALTLDRVTFEDVVDLEAARRVERHVLRDLGREPWNVRDLCLQAAMHPEAGRRDACGRALLELCDDSSSNALFWLARRHEAARQLGIDGLRWLEAPVQPDVPVVRVARGLLDATDDLAADVLGSDRPWQDVLFVGAATDAIEGWPAQLTTRWVQDLFRSTGLVKDAPIEMQAVPQAACGSSFMRALDRFGIAFYRGRARQLAGRFALAVRPFDPRPTCYGALFASLLATPLFLRKHLGLGQIRARKQAQSLARAALITLRLLALQTAVGACEDPRAAREMHLDFAKRALRTRLPIELAGVLPRIRPTACARLVGALKASTLRDQLVDRYDEDWFDNPRAHEQLREIDVLDRPLLDEAGALDAAQRFAHLAGEVLS
ncbi:MAG: hypothetical protein HY898_35530 [Deltaproteobacteria bacterium]|nr:hypothetical protein [Deltaproteobacteria bacterium]